MSTERRAVLTAVLLALLVVPAAGSGAKYVFTEVADDGGEFYSLSNQVINDAGTVAFLAAIDPPLPGETPREMGVYNWNGGNVGGNTRQVYRGPADLYLRLALNNSATVAFIRGGRGPEYGIFRGTTAADVSLFVPNVEPFRDFDFAYGPLLLSDAGRVGFQAYLTVGADGGFSLDQTRWRTG